MRKVCLLYHCYIWGYILVNGPQHIYFLYLNQVIHQNLKTIEALQLTRVLGSFFILFRQPIIPTVHCTDSPFLRQPTIPSKMVKSSIIILKSVVD
jgi:hypothetical protein